MTQAAQFAKADQPRAATADPVRLAQALVRTRSVNPPGDEAACAALLRPLLEANGFSVVTHDLSPHRPSLVAIRAGRNPSLAPLAFTGHLDTVPFGDRPWRHGPLSATVEDGILYGRGSTDMKAGVAAFVTAAISADSELPRGLMLLLTACEETGCVGARHLAQAAAFPAASAMVIAEPTGNTLALAHKGALHLRVRTTGRTAHGSMPQLGENAVLRAIAAIQAAMAFDPQASPDPLLGRPTLAVTSISGGENVNSIPDRCQFTLDLRTVPGQDHALLLARLAEALQPARLDPPLADLPPVGTPADHPFARCVAGLVASRFGAEAAAPRGMPYFTDGSIFQSALGGCPAVILGPGDPAQAHQTDEHCAVAAIADAAALYRDIIHAWCA